MEPGGGGRGGDGFEAGKIADRLLKLLSLEVFNLCKLLRAVFVEIERADFGLLWKVEFNLVKSFFGEFCDGFCWN